MGGRIAEEIVFGQMTTGAGNDIEQRHRPRPRDGVRVGHEREARARCTSASARARSSSAATSATAARTTPSRPRSRSTPRSGASSPENYDRARKQVVVDNLDKLKLLAEALLEYETIDGEEIDTLFAGGRLDRKPSTWATTSSAAKVRREAPARRSAPRAPSIFAPPRPLPDPEKA